MTKEATLVSFKDLMQAKMEREQYEVADASPVSVGDGAVMPLLGEPDASLNSANDREDRSHLPLDNSVANTYLPTYQDTYLPTKIPTYLSNEIDKQPIAPERDFSKLPNSVKRAVEQGKFPGSSLAIYLYLYSLTRGAIKPKRSVRVSKPDLKTGSNIRADKTLLRYIDHLQRLGFIQRTIFNGNHEGNEYEVFLPEEIKNSSPTYLPTKQPTYLIKEIPTLPMKQKSVGRYVEPQVNKDSYDHAKTSFKDNRENDDEERRVSESLAIMGGKLDAATKELTGKGISKNEAEKWATLADLLILELKTAARRTNGVSSVPAFLTEVLRRQFFAARQSSSSSAKSVKAKTDTVGKPDGGAYEIKPLDRAGREAALEQLREFADEEFLQDFRKWYTPEDWEYGVWQR